jgi:hexosaminidase
MSVKQIDTAKATERSVLVGGSFETQKFNSKSKLFGLVLEGYVNIDQDGLYTFTTSSDDGSTLIIDDRLVVDNDGRHSTFDKTGLISLLKGFHKIQIRYFQIDDGELKIYISGPNRAKTELQPSALFN